MNRNQSLPTRGAWIEIAANMANTRSVRSLPTRGAWIEIRAHFGDSGSAGSLPTRGAWIEILVCKASDFED